MRCLGDFCRGPPRESHLQPAPAAEAARAALAGAGVRDPRALDEAALREAGVHGLFTRRRLLRWGRALNEREAGLGGSSGAQLMDPWLAEDPVCPLTICQREPAMGNDKRWTVRLL